MTAEKGAFKFAGVNYPLVAQPPGTELLAACDPTVAKILDFISSVLTTYLEAALVGSATGFAPIDAVVKMTTSVNPSDIAKTDQFDFPLLAISRWRSEKNQKTANWLQSTWRLRAAYIFPPLGAAQAIQLLPALNAVEQIIVNRLHYGFDPSYNNGERILETAGIASCRVLSSEIGRWDVSNELDFHGWFGELLMTEQEMPTTEGLEKLTVTTVKITDESTQPGNPDDVINARV
jgi:hypothetical protein